MLNINNFFNKKQRNVSGFTIIELLVVVVVVGILAAITIASYVGISNKANIATIQSDLSSASKKMNMYYALYNSYPESMPNDGSGKYCPSSPVVDRDYCIKPTGGVFVYSAPSPTVDFSLRLNSGDLSYSITKNSSPYSIPTIPVTAIGSISGTAQTGQVLAAGVITPASATVSYQWQASAMSNGIYSDINGATSSTYLVSPKYNNQFLKVSVTGSGDYIGTQTSAYVQIEADSNWLTIGSQTWAKTNQNNGTMIAGVNEQSNNAVLEKFCYNNSESNCTTYGGLYQWNEAMQYSNIENSRGICPAGSHIPSDNEWKILEMQLGMTQVQADSIGWRGTDQGNQLRVGGSSGLNVPFAGNRYTDKQFYNMASYAHLWSSTESSSSAWTRYIASGQATMDRSAALDLKVYAYSVRCLAN